LLPRAPYPALIGILMGMGWLGLLGVVQYSRAVGVRGMSWALGGAAFYTAGAIFELVKWPEIFPGDVGHHEVFHVMVIGGTICHIIFITRFVIRYQHQPSDQIQLA
jgi:hemolysin III